MRRDPPVHSIRILYTPLVTAVISFFSYRFFRSYTYYSLVEIGALHSFVSETNPDPVHSIQGMLELVIFCQHQHAELMITQGYHSKRIPVSSRWHSHPRTVRPLTLPQQLTPHRIRRFDVHGSFR